MKKSLFALVAVGALSGVAHAQSSVTVYGIIDEGLTGGNTAVSGGGAVNTPNGVVKSTGLGFTSGNASTSRIGFKGSEDLGGGLSAFFTYEIKMDNDSTAGFSTARQAFVGVKKNGWGSIAAGTQNTPIYDAVLSSDPGGVNNIAGNLITTSSKGAQGALPAGTGVATNQPYATRLANTASIKTDVFGGFTARALILANSANTTETTTNTATSPSVGGTGVLATNGTASVTNNQSGYGIGVDYTWNKLLVTANYQAFKASSTLNTIGVAPTLFSPAGVTTAATNTQDSGQYYAATYDFGILKAFGQYVNRKVANDINTAFYQKYTAQQIGVRSFVTPTVEAWASAAMGRYNAYSVLTTTSAGTTAYQPGKANLNAFQLGTNYWLSKRTNLYAIYGQTATSNYTATSASSNPVAANQNNYSVGVRHTF